MVDKVPFVGLDDYGYLIKTFTLVSTDTDTYEIELNYDIEDGQEISVKIPSSNSGSVTFENVSGVGPSGAKNVVTSNGNSYVGMIEDRTHRFMWDGVNDRWVCLDPSSLQKPTTSTDPGLAFDTWRTPNANRTTLIIMEIYTETDGNDTGLVNVSVDESGGTVADYVIRGFADSRAGTNVRNIENICIIVPPNGSYRVANVNDPNGANSIAKLREFTL